MADELSRRLDAAVKALHENPNFFRDEDPLFEKTCQWILEGVRYSPRPAKPDTALNKSAKRRRRRREKMRARQQAGL